MNAGATPKLTTSASESSWAPRSLVERVSRATEPSIASKNIPTKIRSPATVSEFRWKKGVSPTGFIA